MYVSNEMISSLRAAIEAAQYRTIVLLLSTRLDEQDLADTPADWQEGDNTPAILQCRLGDIIAQQADNGLLGYEAVSVWETTTYRTLLEMYALALGAIAARKRVERAKVVAKVATYRPFAALQGLVS